MHTNDYVRNPCEMLECTVDSMAWTLRHWWGKWKPASEQKEQHWMTAMNNQEMFKKVSTDTVTCFLMRESYQLARSMHFKSISTTQITAGDKNSPFRTKRAEARQGFHGFFFPSQLSISHFKHQKLGVHSFGGTRAIALLAKGKVGRNVFQESTSQHTTFFPFISSAFT